LDQFILGGVAAQFPRIFITAAITTPCELQRLLTLPLGHHYQLLDAANIVKLPVKHKLRLRQSDQAHIKSLPATACTFKFLRRIETPPNDNTISLICITRRALPIKI
jgi:hypothetical protein